MYIRN